MIEIKNISFSYPIDIKLKKQRPKVFDKFFLNFKENNIYGLLGKNGMGKSTLLYLINGLNDTQSGSIYIDGDMVTHRNPVTLSKIFLVPEEFDLPEMSLKSYVKLNRAFYPDFSMEILENCLRDFELEDFGKLSGLSMGQKKKVYMSFALATNAKYLLMDEPTNGLDIPSKKQFRKVVAQNMTEDRCILISTHQVHDVEQLIDHVLILGNDNGYANNTLLNKSVADLTNEYTFEYRSADDTDGVIYSEPSVKGNAVIAKRRGNQDETQVNLELLLNAINTVKL